MGFDSFVFIVRGGPRPVGQPVTEKPIKPKTEKKLAAMARQELKRRGKSDQEIARGVKEKVKEAED